MSAANMLAFCCGSVHFCQLPELKLIHEYESKSAKRQVTAASWSHFGAGLAVVRDDGVAEMLVAKRATPRLAHRVPDLPGGAACVRFLNVRDKLAAFGTRSGAICVYDAKSKQITKTLKVSDQEQSPVTLIDVDQKDTHIATASQNAEVCLFSNVCNKLTTKLKLPDSGAVTALRYSTRQKHLLGVGDDAGTVAVWDANTCRRVFYRRQVHFASVQGIAFAPDRNGVLVTVGLDRNLRVLDLTDSGANGFSLEVLLDYPATSLDVNDTYIAVGTMVGSVYLYDLRQLKPNPLAKVEGPRKRVNAVLFQPHSLNRKDATATLLIAEDTHESPVLNNQSDDAPSLKSHRRNSDSFLVFGSVDHTGLHNSPSTSCMTDFESYLHVSGNSMLSEDNSRRFSTSNIDQPPPLKPKAISEVDRVETPVASSASKLKTSTPKENGPDNSFPNESGTPTVCPQISPPIINGDVLVGQNALSPQIDSKLDQILDALKGLKFENGLNIMDWNMKVQTILAPINWEAVFNERRHKVILEQFSLLAERFDASRPNKLVDEIVQLKIENRRLQEENNSLKNQIEVLSGRQHLRNNVFGN